MKHLQLRDIWSKEIVEHDGVARIDCLPWMSRTTLDIIGLAGKIILSYLSSSCCFYILKYPAFNYKFNALSGDPENNELMRAFSTIFKAGQKLSPVPVLRALYRPLRFLVRIGIITSSFYYLIGLQRAPNDDARDKANAVMRRIGMGLLKQIKSDKSSTRKDILSVLAQANTMEEKAHQMSDGDVLSRVYKLILEWCLYLHPLTIRDPYFYCCWS